MSILVIVESPAKCGKIESFLGPGYKCIATYGHIQELSDLKHVNIEKNFYPSFKPIASKYNQLTKLKKAIGEASDVLIATDDDREGEGIGWHVCKYFGLDINNTKRIIFHEITKSAITKAVSKPGKLNMDIVYAQQARQILDLIVGFKLSPLLWANITRKSSSGLSAGRCQTPALRLIYENQKDINESPGKKVYNTTGYFTSKNIQFQLDKQFNSETDMEKFLEDTVSHEHIYTCSKSKEVYKQPPLPFTTSSIQQMANNEMHISPKDTMKILQTLYEGGYITYMRTDCAIYSEEFIKDAEPFIKKEWGDDYVHENIMRLTQKPEKSSKKKKKKEKEDMAQEAHEAIRPTNINVKTIESTQPRERRMYEMIWRNTVESCMSPAKFSSITAKINAAQKCDFKHTSELMLFAGWKIVKGINNDGSYYNYLKQLTDKSSVKYNKITSKITLKELKSHYTEAKLVQLLEQRGIGRPSTFSSLVDKIQEREYVKKENIEGKKITCIDFELEEDEISEIHDERVFGNEKNKLVILPLGIIVLEFLLKHFTNLFDYEYTKNMEQELDFIAKGEKVWHELCSDCYNEIVKSIEPLKGNEKESIKIDENHTYIIGKHGPVIKHTIGDNTNFKSVKKDIDIKKLRNGEYKLEEILETQKFSGKILGQYKDCDLVLKKGKFGLYVVYGENSKSLNGINIEEHDITYEDVIRFIENSNKDSSIIRILNQQLSLRKGKYGNYIFYKTESIKKPQFLKLKGFNKNPETCSKDEFINWIKTTYKLK